MKWPKKSIQVVHGSVVLSCPKGKHAVRWTTTGQDPNHMRQTFVTGTFAQVVAKTKRKALKVGEGTEMWIHGASENTSDFVVTKGKLVKA